MASSTPERMCIACRTRRPQAALIRVARHDGVVRLDAGRRRSGRGAYVCRDPRCLELAEKRHAFRRALGGEMDEGLRAALRLACAPTDAPT